MDADPLTLDLLWDVDPPPCETLQGEAFLLELFALLDQGPVELAVLITHDGKMRALNQQYRGKDRTTDVLSFPNAVALPHGAPRHLGDLVISYDQALRQAQDLTQPIEVELRFLMLHGVLHLLGYDHETDNGEMMQKQADLKLQLSNYFPTPTEDSFIG